MAVVGLQVPRRRIPDQETAAGSSCYVVVYPSSPSIPEDGQGNEGRTGQGQEAHARDARVLEEEREGGARSAAPRAEGGGRPRQGRGREARGGTAGQEAGVPDQPDGVVQSFRREQAKEYASCVFTIQEGF